MIVSSVGQAWEEQAGGARWTGATSSADGSDEFGVVGAFTRGWIDAVGAPEV